MSYIYPCMVLASRGWAGRGEGKTAHNETFYFGLQKPPWLQRPGRRHGAQPLNLNQPPHPAAHTAMTATHHGMLCYSALSCHGVPWRAMAWHSVLCYGMAWHGIAWHAMACCGCYVAAMLTLSCHPLPHGLRSIIDHHMVMSVPR